MGIAHCLMRRNGQWIEVQIRGERMNDVCRTKNCAHWKYKEGGGSEGTQSQLEKWLKTIREILDDPQRTLHRLSGYNRNWTSLLWNTLCLHRRVKDNAAKIQQLDFAFSLHTDIGSHCIGIKVNHKLVPLSLSYKSGDQLEFWHLNHQRVQPQWRCLQQPLSVLK